MADDDQTGGEVEGSWSPRRSRPAKDKARDDAEVQAKHEAEPADPEDLVHDIEQTREELAETLDAIADRVSPKKAAGRAKKAAKEGVSDAVEAVKDAAGAVRGGGEPVATAGALADAAATTTEPAGGETPYVASLPPAAPSRVPLLAGAGLALVLLYLLKRRRR